MVGLSPDTAHAVEPRLRRVVADELGVDPEELTPEVSLTDELAADSLDVLGLLLAVETEFELALPEAALGAVRTYGDLVSTVTGLAARRPARVVDQPAAVRARVVPVGAGHAAIERAEWLTPYAAQTIVEDALYAGRGARLEVEVPAALSDAEIASVEDRFARLGPRGVDVRVRRLPGAATAVVVRSAS